VQEYNVVLSETAENDLDEVVEYLGNFSANIARSYYDEIMVKAFSLAFMPHRCSFVQDDALRAKGYRWLFVRNYTIFFVIDDTNNVVDIQAVMYSGREYTALL